MYAFIEITFSLALFINAGLFVPQAIKVFQKKSAGELSLLTFGGFNLIQLSVLLHGLLHSDWLLVAGTGLSLITCGIITFMIIFYKLFPVKKSPSTKNPLR